MKQIYLNEYNLEADNSVFLPYSTGLLQAYAQQSDRINQNYDFQPIIFQKDTVKNIVDKYDNPDVVGFSTVIWNYRLSLAVAKEIKEKFPKCLTVFGGPYIEKNNQIFKDHPYVDMAIYGEGEKLFRQILINWLDNNILTRQILCDFAFEKDLDIFPSPYLLGIYDKIIDEHPNIEFKALVECNRNCPFGCDYCFWGQPELEKRIKYHSQAYILEEAQWIAKKKIDYVFCTDANFGMFQRDIETAKTYATIKKNYGYPQKIRVCYGKNAANTIFETASVLNQANMDKLITLSVQSTNPDTLKAVHRQNIKSDIFKTLQKKYLDNNISTYTEFILGLPCETKQSFYDGLEQTIRIVKHNQIFVYPCQILPNTRLASQEYREKYGLITTKPKQKIPHTNIVSKDWIQEEDEIVIGTNTMSVDDWMDCTIMSWVVQLFHSLKVGYDIVEYIHNAYNFSYMEIYSRIVNFDIDEICEFRAIADFITMGEHWSQSYPTFGNMYYEPEEMAYLRILYNKDKFYKQLWKELRSWLEFTLNLPVDNLFDIVVEQPYKLLDTNNVTDWTKFAINTVIRGGKDN